MMRYWIGFGLTMLFAASLLTQAAFYWWRSGGLNELRASQGGFDTKSEARTNARELAEAILTCLKIRAKANSLAEDADLERLTRLQYKAQAEALLEGLGDGPYMEPGPEPEPSGDVDESNVVSVIPSILKARIRKTMMEASYGEQEEDGEED